MVFWIDQNTFASSLMSKFMKDKHMAFYTHDKAQDFAFLVEDLKPQLIVLDQKTVCGNLSGFKQEYLNSPQFRATPVVAIGSWEGLEFIENKHALIDLPLKPPVLVISLGNWLFEVSTLRS